MLPLAAVRRRRPPRWTASARRLARSGRVPVLPGADGLVPWCSPEPRAVLLPGSLRGLALAAPAAAHLRLARPRLDEAFDGGGRGLRRPRRDLDHRPDAGGYAALHADGGAHSIEVWDGDRLVGGLYGVLTGRVFSGESMFHRETDASKVALVDLVARLREAGVAVLDTQQATEHLAALGQVLVRRGRVPARAARAARRAGRAARRRPAGRRAQPWLRQMQDEPAVVGRGSGDPGAPGRRRRR